MDRIFILFLTARMLLLIGIGIVAAMLVGWYCGDSSQVLWGFGGSAVFCLVVSLAAMLFSLKRRHALKPGQERSVLREGVLAVFNVWFVALIMGGLPFVFGGHFTPVDAVFETASGISTTGASIIQSGMRLWGGVEQVGGLETLPRAILFWRALLNWFGGSGFVMFALILLPVLGAGKHLYNAEVPGLKNIYDQETSRIANTARLTLGCYALWTAVVVVAYRYCGMGNWFDAVCHGFATVATGGFGNYSDSFAHFPSPLVQWIAIAAMAISSCNLMLMLRLLLHGKFAYHKDEETRFFLGIVLAVTAIFTIQLYCTGSKLEYLDGTPIPHRLEALCRTAAFQVVSLISTTGFATSDYLTWALPGLPGLLLLIMVCGGCGGSTSGGMKVARVLVVWKQALGEAHRKIFPHLMPNVMLNHARVDMPLVRQTMGFAIIFVVVTGICTLLLPYLSSMDFETAFSCAISAISNVGPGLSKVGPASSYAWMSAPAKYLLSFIMIVGRLELYTVLVVFLPSFWRNK